MRDMSVMQPLRLIGDETASGTWHAQVRLPGYPHAGDRIRLSADSESLEVAGAEYRPGWVVVHLRSRLVTPEAARAMGDAVRADGVPWELVIRTAGMMRVLGDDR